MISSYKTLPVAEYYITIPPHLYWRPGEWVGHLPGQVHHVDSLAGDPGRMVGHPARDSANYHVRVANGLHLKRVTRLYGSAVTTHREKYDFSHFVSLDMNKISPHTYHKRYALLNILLILAEVVSPIPRDNIWNRDIGNLWLHIGCRHTRRHSL